MSELLGNLVDSLGVCHNPEPGEIVSDALVVMKVVDAEGRVSLRVCGSAGMSWIEKVGMLRIAEHVELAELNELGNGDD